jgi:hypothetical protein
MLAIPTLTVGLVELGYVVKPAEHHREALRCT